MEQVRTLTRNSKGNHFRFQRVMLIDDNEIENFVNKKLIETTGFAASIQCCLEAEEALELISKMKTEKLPELIFLDIKMPGMDGFEFLDRYAQLADEIHERIKIVMLSTSESFKDLNRANKNKFVFRFLNKPLLQAALDAIVL
ncbi:MAG: response regulator [Bacteroidia bacterium]|nr:response regulator [Bacteroidia bacterium]MCZ2276507.1 response regulator [Bacteroidia bacterium]